MNNIALDFMIIEFLKWEGMWGPKVIKYEDTFNYVLLRLFGRDGLCLTYILWLAAFPRVLVQA